MKIWIIRHGEPENGQDSLTEKGWREAHLLADRLEKETMDYLYVSPLVRARETAEPLLTRLNREAVILPWLTEFSYPVTRDDGTTNPVPWDTLPAQWMSHPENFTLEGWKNTELSRSGDLERHYDEVIQGLDLLLAEHGYARDGFCYRAERPNTDTLVFFCHFGLETVLLSHLLNLPLYTLWHATCARTSSITTLVTEERQKGIASFRMLTFGDVSHLTSAGEEPSFHARFCEIYDDMSQRH